MGVGRELLLHVRGRQIRFLGHVMRSEELENLSLTGRVPGRRARGRKREKYMDGIKRAIGDGSTTGQILHMTRDRKVWHSVVANVCRGTALR